MNKNLLTIIASAFIISSVQAQLISSESFNYPAGSIVGNNGGTGWSSPWLTTTFNTANTMIAAPGMTQPPQVIGVGYQDHQVGNDFRNFRFMDTTSSLALSLMDNVGDPGLTNTTNYRWGKAYGKDGTTIWFSFLFYRSNNLQGYGGMHLMYGMDLAFDQYGDKKAHQRFQFGADNSHTHYMLSRTINANPNLPASCSVTIEGNVTVNASLHLLVQRIDFKAGQEVSYLWIDPISCQAPDTALANVKMYHICDFRFNAVNVGAGNSANYEMDELRIGLTYNDVVNCASGGLNIYEPLLLEKFAFPNPNDGNFDLRFESETETNATVTINNMLGQTVCIKKIKLESGHNDLPLSTEELNTGIYIITLKTESGISVTQRMAIQH